jgi:hypothetical protein
VFAHAARPKALASAITEQLVVVEDVLMEDRPVELSDEYREILLALGDAIKAQSVATVGQLRKLDEEIENIKARRLSLLMTAPRVVFASLPSSPNLRPS